MLPGESGSIRSSVSLSIQVFCSLGCVGTWSGEPFGNDAAADFAWELDGQLRWTLVKEALRDVMHSHGRIDADTASIAIAAAEVVAHGLGRPTQVDVYTASVVAFTKRARRPSRGLARFACRALAVATSSHSELTEQWRGQDGEAWRLSNERLREALTAKASRTG